MELHYTGNPRVAALHLIERTVGLSPLWATVDVADTYSHTTGADHRLSVDLHDDLRWSSGEFVVVKVLKWLAGVLLASWSLYDLEALDETWRAAVVDAVGIACGTVSKVSAS